MKRKKPRKKVPSTSESDHSVGYKALEHNLNQDSQEDGNRPTTSDHQSLVDNGEDKIDSTDQTLPNVEDQPGNSRSRAQLMTEVSEHSSASTSYKSDDNDTDIDGLPARLHLTHEHHMGLTGLYDRNELSEEEFEPHNPHLIQQEIPLENEFPGLLPDAAAFTENYLDQGNAFSTIQGRFANRRRVFSNSSDVVIAADLEEAVEVPIPSVSSSSTCSFHNGEIQAGNDNSVIPSPQSTFCYGPSLIEYLASTSTDEMDDSDTGDVFFDDDVPPYSQNGNNGLSMQVSSSHGNSEIHMHLPSGGSGSGMHMQPQVAGNSSEIHTQQQQPGSSNGMYTEPQQPGSSRSGMFLPPQQPGSSRSGMFMPPQQPGTARGGMFPQSQQPARSSRSEMYLLPQQPGTSSNYGMFVQMQPQQHDSSQNRMYTPPQQPGNSGGNSSGAYIPPPPSHSSCGMSMQPPGTFMQLLCSNFPIGIYLQFIGSNSDTNMQLPGRSISEIHMDTPANNTGSQWGLGGIFDNSNDLVGIANIQQNAPQEAEIPMSQNTNDVDSDDEEDKDTGTETYLKPKPQ